MFIKSKSPSLFIRQADINKLCKWSGLKVVGLKRWIRLSGEGLEITQGMANLRSIEMIEYLGVATALGLKMENLELDIIKMLEKENSVCGLLCIDCLLTHPMYVNKAIALITRSRLRKLNKKAL